MSLKRALWGSQLSMEETKHRLCDTMPAVQTSLASHPDAGCRRPRHGEEPQAGWEMEDARGIFTRLVFELFGPGP